MTYRKLGCTGLVVGAIVLGIEGFKAKLYAETKAMIDYAVEHGINFMDLCIVDIARTMGE